jgi:hypothetical protein
MVAVIVESASLAFISNRYLSYGGIDEQMRFCFFAFIQRRSLELLSRCAFAFNEEVGIGRK